MELQDTDFINITLGELHAEIEATGLYDRRITKTELKDAYQFLSRYNICERIGELSDDDTRLIIYPTINYILPVTKIDELTNRINNYRKEIIMKTLTKVKLINWHSFTNESFEVYHNTLMTGENSAGKSTILDAIQYVLTVGTCKFNKAASDIGTRTLESYIRCKTGKEGQEYERNGDVSCYIALEFYDEKQDNIK